MITAWAKARHMPAAVAGAIIATGVGTVIAPPPLDVGLALPIIGAWYVALALVAAATLPLAPAYGVLERTFTRAARDRTYRVVLIALLHAGPLALMLHVGVAEPVVVLWAVLLASTALVVATIRSEIAWAVVLVIGGGCTVWEHVDLHRPLTAVLSSLAPWWVALYALAAMALYVVRGR